MWHYPDVERKPLAISTEHRANVFGCQILPCTSNSRVVSGAMDNTVQLHDIVRPAGRHPSYRSPSAGGSASAGQWSSPGAGGGRRHQRASDDSQVMRVLANTTIYHCHTGRVKVRRPQGYFCTTNLWAAGRAGCRGGLLQIPVACTHDRFLQPIPVSDAKHSQKAPRARASS